MLHTHFDGRVPVRSTTSGCDLRMQLMSTLSTTAFAIGALGIAVSASMVGSTSAEAKTPGKTYCFLGVCHRVMTLEETRRAVGKRATLHASHYDDPKKDRFNPSNLTSSGEYFRANVPDNAASPKYPNGTVILAWNPLTYLAAILRINNAGPYWGSRTLDVSRAAAEKLGFARQGVAKLQVQVVRAPTREDVTYRKGRRYAPVPGPIGKHTSFDLALADTSRLLRLPIPGTGTGTLIADLEAAERALAVAMTRSLPPEALSGDAFETPAVASLEIASATLPLEAAEADESMSFTAEAPPIELAAAPSSLAATEVVAPPATPSLQRRARIPAQRLKPITAAAAPAPKPVLVSQAQRKPVKAQRIALAAPRSSENTLQQQQPPRRARIAAVRSAPVVDWDEDDDAAPRARRRAAPVYSMDRLPASCREPGVSCEVSTSPNGSVISSRSWRVSSSKRP